jgi:type IV pilus assembly protein PilA
MKKQKGFSLIELLIVVAIILIIAAIAIPNLMRSKMAANESSAVGSLRTINTAEDTYCTNFPAVGFAANLASLGNGGAAGACAANPAALTTAACLIDDSLSSGTKSGFLFTATGTGGTPNVLYTSIANPTAKKNKRFTDFRVNRQIGLLATRSVFLCSEWIGHVFRPSNCPR